MRPIIPPRKDAKIEQHGNRKAEPLPRDETIRTIRKRGIRTWEKTSGYHRRSIAETQIGRYKQILGDTLHARTLTHQQTETRVGCAILNRLLHLAKHRILSPNQESLNYRHKKPTPLHRFHAPKPFPIIT